jgi:Ca2+-transporting ATPase
MPETERQFSWHTQEATAILEALGSTIESGLSTSEAAARLVVSGPNEFESDRPPTILKLVANQLADFMIGILILAALISGFLGDIVDTIAILIIVLLNAAVGVFQEYRAERAVAALREMSAPLARVIRDGSEQEIPTRDLVPGDIILLAAGDVVPADIRLLNVIDLGVDESAMTGESVPVSKDDHIGRTDGATIPEQHNMVWKSTMITRGRATGVAVLTGQATEIGRIATLLRGDTIARTPLQTRMTQFSRRIALAVVAICAMIFVTGLMQGQPALLMLMTALSLAVAAVPEALPAVITVALGLGARRLGDLKALVRRLPAVESLGSVNYICADKTGTLTENRMQLGAIVAGGERYDDLSCVPSDLRKRIGWVMTLCNDVDTASHPFKGDPTEVALLQGAMKDGFEKSILEAEMPRIAELPFQSDRQCMVTLHRATTGGLAFMKGAPERVVEACGLRASSEYLEIANGLAGDGYRVLALACRETDQSVEDISAIDIESGWSFLGFAGLIDPPKDGVSAAIKECRSAGIVPVMITGDHPATAMAIAKKIGLAGDNNRLITGMELESMSAGDLESCVEEIRVYARLNPEQKIRIVQALQKAGHFVAMTGDGVNDAPALKQATIGIAMGQRGTEVAREAAEIVLLDDSFPTIVEAVHEGRRIYDDIRKFIRYTMTSNSGEIWVLMLAPFLGLPIPLLPLHILWINLVTDGFPGLALSAEPAERDVMQRKPRPAEEGIFTTEMVTHIFWVGLTIGGLTLATQAFALSREIPQWQTMVFSVLVFAQLFHSLAIRSERHSLLSIGLFTNPALIVAVVATVAAQLLVIYVPAFNIIFHTMPLSAMELAACFAIGAIVLVVVETEKRLRRPT